MIEKEKENGPTFPVKTRPAGGVSPAVWRANLPSGKRRIMPVTARLIAAIVWVFSAEVAAGVPDLAREQRMADEIEDVILDGEADFLDDGTGHRFLTIQTESEISPAKGTVVILHGRGLHPDWANVTHPLRVGLTRYGWNTLAIQLPVLEKDASYNDYFPTFRAAEPRIELALELARERTAGKVVLLAHSCGSHMAQHWILQRSADALSRFDAYVGIGMGATDYGQPMREPFALARMPQPVLDVYGERDYPAVKRLAPLRRAAIAAAGNPLSVQRVVADSDHYFVDRGDALLEAVVGWLDTLQ